MSKRIINTDKSPAPIGPYNQAVLAGNTLYVSGQVGINPITGEIGPDVSSQAEQVLKNLQNILEEAGYSFENVVKSTIFLRDMADFTVVNEIYGKYFDENAPARETVAVLGLPRDVRVEISMIAYKG